MSAHKPDGQTTGERIVFVDDDPLVLEAIGELLRSKGYEVHLAHDGLEGLLTIRKLAPTYVLLDIVLPKIDGSRLCWLVRQDPRLRNTLIIAFSGLSPALCANMSETLPPSEFRVEGGEGMRDECPA